MPSSLYFKIHRILKKNSDSGYLCFLDQDTLLNELPAALKNEIMCMTHEKILNSFSFFRGKAPSFVLDILHEFTHISLSPDEVIYRKGDWIEDSKYTFSIYIYSLFLTQRKGSLCNSRGIHISEFCKWFILWRG